MPETPIKPDHLQVIASRRAAIHRFLSDLLIKYPFTLEIGCGHGHFLVELARNFPERLHIGIDIEAERIERACRKANRARLPNLRFFQADAWDFLSVLEPGNRIGDTYILFPDPWPKRRHHKNRLIRSDFLQLLAGRVGRGGRLYFRTDFDSYFADARSTLAACTSWRLVPDQPWPFEAPTVFQERAEKFQSLIFERSPRSISPLSPSNDSAEPGRFS